MLNSSPINSKTINGAGGKGRKFTCKAFVRCGAIGVAFASLLAHGAGQLPQKIEGIASYTRKTLCAAQGLHGYRGAALATLSLNGGPHRVPFGMDIRASASARYSASASGGHGYIADIAALVYSWRIAGSMACEMGASASLLAHGAGRLPQRIECQASAQKAIRASASMSHWTGGIVYPARVFPMIAQCWHGYGATSSASALLRGSVHGGHYYYGILGAETAAILFRWREGIAYLVVQNPTVNGLMQGGVKRDALMGAVQRLGL